MLFLHLGRPSQAIIKVVLWGHPVFLQRVAANRKRDDTHSPWDCTMRRLESVRGLWDAFQSILATETAPNNSALREIMNTNIPVPTARADPHLFCWLAEYVFIQTTSSHSYLNFLLSQSRSKTVPITARSSWQWFKWERTMLSEAAERSICMKRSMASNSWVHLFTSLQTGNL